MDVNCFVSAIVHSSVLNEDAILIEMKFAHNLNSWSKQVCILLLLPLMNSSRQLLRSIDPIFVDQASRSGVSVDHGRSGMIADDQRSFDTDRHFSYKWR